MNKQEEFIQKIKDISITPIKGAINYYNNKQKKWIPGKRESLKKRKIWDHTTVPTNAVYYELDARSYKSNYKLAKKIINVLESRNWQYYIYSSSKKGIHIETFFDKPEMKEEETKDLFIKALSYNISFKNIRFWIWNLILNEAGISHDIRGNGKIVDSHCINFDETRDKTKLLRICGGRKIYRHKITEEEQIYYKTWIKKEDFESKSHYIKHFEKVDYPDKLRMFQFNEYEFIEFLNNYVEQHVKNNTEPLKKINLEQEGGYINLESVQRIREGLSKGQRNIGAQILAIAMANDNIKRKKQETIMKKYVNNCSQAGDPFTTSEAIAWINWVEAQPNVFWNCSLPERAGLHDASMCEYCKKKNKDAYKFLKNKTILDQIKNVLDNTIVGENDTKMLMFLLMLSKDFPSRTGRPGWNIKSDPISQNIILSSDSSSGKTYMTKKILKLFGEKGKDYFIISRITKNVLNYMIDINMDKKIIFIEELQGLDEATSQLRLWMSEGELTLKTVEKVKNKEGIEVNMSVDKTTRGQPVFVSNQAEGVIEEQLNNRSWVLGMDTTSAQTGKILSYQDNINIGDIDTNKAKIRKIKDALRQLKQYHFIVPYANWKAMNIPISDVRSRRDYTKFITLIKCSAYLHQKQRWIVENKVGDKFIICDFKDYDVAKEYSHQILGATFSGLSSNQIDILNHIRKSNWNQDFMISDLMRNLGKSQSYWYGQLNQLVDLGFLICDKNPGKSNIYELNKDKSETVIKLPSKEELKRVSYYDLIERFEKNQFKIKKTPSRVKQEIIGADFSEKVETALNLKDKSSKSNIENKKNQAARIIFEKNTTMQQKEFKSRLQNKNFNKNNRCDSTRNEGEIGRSDIINYMKKNTNKHFISLDEIREHFNNSNNIIELINLLKTEGTIIQSKNGYALL